MRDLGVQWAFLLSNTGTQRENFVIELDLKEGFVQGKGHKSPDYVVVITYGRHQLYTGLETGKVRECKIFQL